MKREPMPPERAKQIEELYHSALELESARRTTFLAEACAGDEALLQEVASLVSAHERAGAFIEGSPDQVAAQMLDFDWVQSLAGRRIGRYELLFLLGAGGMGKVFRARDTVLDREVAIKILPQHLAENAMALARFKTEARAIAALSHPNILAIYDFGTEQGVTFAVTELLAGETLRQCLSRSALSWSKAVECGLTLAEGLAAAHAKGIFHRDLKPENIFLTADGQVKILDFGLARIQRAVSGSASPGSSIAVATEPGIVMGTVGYMSPEQVRGEEVGAPTDIFSLGCVLYEMMTGRRAFGRSTTQDTLAAILRDDAPPLGEAGQSVPPAVEQLIGRCLEKEAEKRYASGSELANDLREALRRPKKAIGRPLSVGAGLRRALWVGGFAGLSLLVFLTALRWRGASNSVLWPARTLSLLPGNEDSPDLSADGNFVAFSWSGSENEGPGDIYIKAIKSESLRQLTHTPFQENFPAWSPDGTQIAFVRTGQGIFVVSQLGSPERKVSDSGSYVRWTPDNRSLLIRASTAGGAFGVFQISLDTLERRQINLTGSRNVYRFDVSPDGKNLAFIEVRTGGVADAYVASIAGGDTQRRTNWNAPMGGVIWTPDGRELIVNVGYGYPLSMFRVPAFGSRPEHGVPIAVSSSANQPTISRPPSGGPARLAFLNLQANISLRLVDLTAPRPGGVIQAVQPLVDTSLVDYPGSFSQDGSKIVFTSSRTGDPPPGTSFAAFFPEQLWVAGRDGSGLRQLTKLDAGEIGSAAWSPDGKWIVFEAAVDGNMDIHITRADSGESRRLTTEPSAERFPSWSHDGSTIYFSSGRTGRSEVWKIPAVGGMAAQITSNGGLEPIESMDGKSIYYLQPQTPRPILKRVPVGGGEETVVLQGVAARHWAVTEKGIFFATPDGPVSALDLYNPSDGMVTRLGRLPFQISRIGTLGRMTVSRDGQSALTVQTERWAKDILFVDNFR